MQEGDPVEPPGAGVAVGRGSEAGAMRLGSIRERELAVLKSESDGGDADRLGRGLEVKTLTSVPPAHDEPSAADDAPCPAGGEGVVTGLFEQPGVRADVVRLGRGPFRVRPDLPQMAPPRNSGPRRARTTRKDRREVSREPPSMDVDDQDVEPRTSELQNAMPGGKSLATDITGVQGLAPGGDAGGVTPPARRRPSRRTLSEGARVQARTTRRMPPHQPAGIPERAFRCEGVLNAGTTKANARCVLRFLMEALRRQG